MSAYFAISPRTTFIVVADTVSESKRSPAIITACTSFSAAYPNIFLNVLSISFLLPLALSLPRCALRAESRWISAQCIILIVPQPQSSLFFFYINIIRKNLLIKNKVHGICRGPCLHHIIYLLSDTHVFSLCIQQ